MAAEDFHKQSTLPNLTGDDKPLPHLSHIGPYKIEAPLSKGGMSFLYLGLDPKDHSPVVVKILSPKYLTHPEMLEQFLKESEIISLTDHPNIIKLKGHGQWKNGLYIATEFVQGISLKQFIMQQNFSPKTCIEIVLQVAYALLHLHTHGVIHRDLKPENILITEDGSVKVIDFGIAQLIYDKEIGLPSQQGKFLGTPSYMSPEQKKDPLNVTFATDIYSLGVITFELLVGKLSFGSIQLSLLPNDLQAIVEKALDPSLRERYQDIVDFITDISTYLKKEQKRGKGEGIKEVWDHLEKSHLKLLPTEVPKWPPFDMGLAKPDRESDLGSYYDFIRFADQTYFIALGEYIESSVEALSYIGLLKGIIQSLTREYITSANSHFESTTFITALNEMIASHNLPSNFLFQLLYLSPSTNQFSFISCGCGAFIHLPLGTRTPRFLANQNPPLGEDLNHGFYETTENWTEGDLLISHSFDTERSSEKDGQNFEDVLKKIVEKSLQFPAQSQAEGILNDVAKIFPSLVEASPKTVLTIHSIV
ncbi:MAG: protein kinase [Candidatus Neptunochlamydia sp.]|nr:protein kinase [Candidatus Neptunochlamydia sp.]